MSVALLAPAWHPPACVGAAMSLRGGGVSALPYASLNLGTHVGDEASAVARNRALLREGLALPAEPLWLEQVHGATVYRADSAAPLQPPVADAAVSRRPGVVLAILVADCLPVLFCDRAGTVIAAAHAGWRGLAAGVLEETVRAMGVPPGSVIAWLGPAISQAHFEVGDEVRSAFVAQDETNAASFRRNERSRWQCDLPGLARRRLRALGIDSVTDSAVCTFARAAECFSYRRDGRTGRMAALLWLRP